MGKKVKHTAIQSLSTIHVSTLTKLKRETRASEICETRHFESVVVLLFAYYFIFLYYLTQIAANKSAEQNEISHGAHQQTANWGVSRRRRVAGMSKWALLRNGAPSYNSLTVFDIFINTNTIHDEALVTGISPGSKFGSWKMALEFILHV